MKIIRAVNMGRKAGCEDMIEHGGDDGKDVSDNSDDPDDSKVFTEDNSNFHEFTVFEIPEFSWPLWDISSI